MVAVLFVPHDGLIVVYNRIDFAILSCKIAIANRCWKPMICMYGSE